MAKGLKGEALIRVASTLGKPVVSGLDRLAHRGRFQPFARFGVSQTMDSFEFNKIAGAVLGTALFIMAIGIVAEIIYEPEHPEKPGYVIAIVEPTEPGADGKPPPAAEVPPIAVRLASADVKSGESTAKICTTCHNLNKGQPNKVGPNLWGIVGSEPASVPGFNFSPAMRAMKAAGKTWTFEELDAFLAAPQKHVPGTFMTFPGVKDPQKRADVIAYLRTLSDSPVALPVAAEAAPAQPPAEGAAPAGPPANGAAPAAGTAAPQPTPPTSNPPAASTEPSAPTPGPAPETPPATSEQPANPNAAAPAPAPAPAQ